jgi:pimeloyl-ACP methyl ester carboxylesterase
MRAGLLLIVVSLIGCADTRPTVVILATSKAESLDEYAGITTHLPGWRVVSLDLPAHGADRRPHEAAPLTAWRQRIDRGEDVIGTFTRRLSRLIDTLPTTDVVLVGVSRGGFMALHGMATDARIDAVVAFMPVTRLRALREFADADPAVDRFDVARLALAGRPIWMSISRRDERVNDRAAIDAATVLRATLTTTPREGHVFTPEDERAAAIWMRAIVH